MGGVRRPGRGVLRSVEIRTGAPGQTGTAWQAEWRDAAGKRHRKIVGRTKLEAQDVLNKIVRDRDLEFAGMHVERGLSMSVREVADRYVADLKARGARARTVQGAALALQRIVKDLGASTVRDLRRAAVIAWRDRRLFAGASNKTVQSEFGYLRAALNLCVRNELLTANPVWGIRGLKTSIRYQKRKPRALSDRELARLLAAADLDDKSPPPGSGHHSGSRVPRGPLLRALIWTGARYGELRQASWSDLDAERGLLIFREETTKTEKARAIPLRAELLEELLALPRLQASVTGAMPKWHDPIFLTPRGKPWPAHSGNLLKWVNGLMQRAGIAKRDERGRVANIHALRSTWNTRLARHRVAVGTRQKGLGHATSAMTVDVYEDASYEDLREAIESLPPILDTFPDAPIGIGAG